MASYENVLYEKQGSGALITLNRPQVLNAMNQRLCNDLDNALREAEQDSEIRAVVLTGAGHAFSSGEDINEEDRREIEWPTGIPRGSSLVYVYDHLREQDRRTFLGRQLYLWQYPKPLIAAVSGWCFGGGCSLALTCHMTIAADDAVFGQPQIRHGAGTDFIWVLLAGFKNALRYSLTGDHIDAQEAMRIGLINKVVPKGTLLEESFTFVDRLARIAPETIKINLHISRLGIEMMGLTKAWTLNAEFSAMARLSKREEFQASAEEAKKKGGATAFFATRDRPFQPEPFGPRSRR